MPLRSSALLAALAAAIAWTGPAACQDAAPGNPAPEGAAPALIQPDDLVYLGAFRLPGPSGASSWEWGGDALAYSPDGDPDGPDDGFPGSLFGVGHDHQQHVSEVSIPAPVVSKPKSVNELPTARTLQPFTNIRPDAFRDYEIYRVGLAYLPPQGRQSAPKLYWCWGRHMEEHAAGPSHGWCERDLSRPDVAAPWCIAQLEHYATCDYLLEIPAPWADAHTPGMRLATGRFRDGGQGGKGPCLYAVGPWNHGNPPDPGARIDAVPLLQNSTAYVEENHPMDGYAEADEWSGAAWLTAGRKSALVFVGTKGLGKCWYGFAEGTVWPDEGPFPPVPPAPNDQRGWWSERFEARLLLYNPADLAAVAEGRAKPHEPQPYASMSLEPCLFAVKGTQQKYQVRAAAADPERGLLYVVEHRADEDKPLVHVWRATP